MNSTDRRIVAAAQAASHLGEETVRIDVAGIPVTVHAMPPAERDSAPTRRQTVIAINTRHRQAPAPCRN